MDDFQGKFYPHQLSAVAYQNHKIIVCRMKDLAISRSLVLLSILLFHVMCVDTMGNGEELMSNDTVEIISLNTSQYCFVDDNTIRIDLITTTLLNIISYSEDVIRPLQINFLFPVHRPHLFHLSTKNSIISVFFHYFRVFLYTQVFN